MHNLRNYPRCNICSIISIHGLTTDWSNWKVRSLQVGAHKIRLHGLAYFCSVLPLVYQCYNSKHIHVHVLESLCYNVISVAIIYFWILKFTGDAATWFPIILIRSLVMPASYLDIWMVLLCYFVVEDTAAAIHVQSTELCFMQYSFEFTWVYLDYPLIQIIRRWKFC